MTSITHHPSNPSSQPYFPNTLQLFVNPISPYILLFATSLLSTTPTLQTLSQPCSPPHLPSNLSLLSTTPTRQHLSQPQIHNHHPLVTTLFHPHIPANPFQQPRIHPYTLQLLNPLTTPDPQPPSSLPNPISPTPSSLLYLSLSLHPLHSLFYKQSLIYQVQKCCNCYSSYQSAICVSCIARGYTELFVYTKHQAQGQGQVMSTLGPK